MCGRRLRSYLILLHFSLARVERECPSLRASSEHISSCAFCEQEDDRPARSLFYFTRNGFEFSPEAVVTVRRTRPFFPPLGTVVVMLSLVC